MQLGVYKKSLEQIPFNDAGDFLNVQSMKQTPSQGRKTNMSKICLLITAKSKQPNERNTISDIHLMQNEMTDCHKYNYFAKVTHTSY